MTSAASAWECRPITSRQRCSGRRRFGSVLRCSKTMPDFDAIIFDFDGVLLESEFEGNRQLAELLTDLGHRHSVEDTLKNYVGLAGKDFIAAIEKRIGTELPSQ